ncbi:MAG: MATE family efflux transporter [Clostridia bacterium]|nr:MATE family efflux transporter [Clostridia bacterium]
MTRLHLRNASRDMTSGSIVRQLLAFAIPLMIGNVFQLLYSTVDAVIVGRFVSKEALAAVTSTGPIVNMLVFFFNGFSVGAGVLIARLFGARDDGLHRAVETTLTATVFISAAFTVIGMETVPFMLRLMDTPESVMRDATIYLNIYFAGFTGLLVYNMGSGILRAVGDTIHPLIYLIVTSLTNIALDILFVRGFGMKVEGVAWATVISQMVSAALVMRSLMRAEGAWRFRIGEMCLDWGVLKEVFRIGLPAAIQSVITAFSNTFVQSYINHFGDSCMAGWGSYNKVDAFIMLPMQSMAMAATTFVSQNVGAGKTERADRGTRDSILISAGITAVIAALLIAFAEFAIGLFNTDPEVLEYGTLFMRANTAFLLCNCVNHVLAGALRGRGDSRGPMILMLASFVAIRQVYLFAVSRLIPDNHLVIGLGYPVGWVCCMVLELLYYRRSSRKWRASAKATGA